MKDKLGLIKKRETIHVPAHLSDRAKAIWRSVLKSGRSRQRLAMVQTALEALDRADEAREIINKDGMLISTKEGGMSHSHPLLKIEKDNRALFARLWRELDLTADPY